MAVTQSYNFTQTGLALLCHPQRLLSKTFTLPLFCRLQDIGTGAILRSGIDQSLAHLKQLEHCDTPMEACTVTMNASLPCLTTPNWSALRPSILNQANS